MASNWLLISLSFLFFLQSVKCPQQQPSNFTVLKMTFFPQLLNACYKDPVSRFPSTNLPTQLTASKSWTTTICPGLSVLHLLPVIQLTLPARCQAIPFQNPITCFLRPFQRPAVTDCILCQSDSNMRFLMQNVYQGIPLRSTSVGERGRHQE